ncbi:MAG TPA: prolyl oligopeptidase family serine peptidase [Candidatus Kapabacteria bacterium]|nr:prolyl oligopeptidase family serine peptidase [Candidatus Kapabacteria bacterium]
MNYPHTRIADQTDTYHGVEISDPYRWLEDDRSEETAAWVQEQNRLTFEYLKSIPFRDRYRDRLTELMNSPRYGIPAVRNGRYFYLKNNGLQNHPVIYVRAEGSQEAYVVLDPNTLSDDGTTGVATYAASRDGELLAYALSQSGSDWREIRVRNVDTGEDLPDVIRWAKFFEITWTVDSRGFFYARYPEPTAGDEFRDANLNHSIYYHRLGTDQADDILVYSRPDHPDRILFFQMTDGGRYLIPIERVAGKDSIFYIDLVDPLNPRFDTPARPLIGTFDAEYSLICARGTEFYLTTDRDASRGSVIAVDIARENAVRTVIPEGEDAIQSAWDSGDYLFIVYLHNACHRVAFYDFEGCFLHDLDLPMLGSVVVDDTIDTDGSIFYAFSSFFCPTTIYRYDIATRRNEPFFPVDQGMGLDRYRTEQVWYHSKDGTRVPMFVMSALDRVMDGTAPTILHAYGGFGTSLTPAFVRWALMWLEQGGVVAIANVRGGGEFGEEWYRAGVQERKQNTFDDFIAAGESLIALGYASKRTLAAFGGSNGGLVVAASMCRRPDLFAVALPQVAVTDMLRYHLFTIGIAWSGDYGLSDDPAMFPALLAYSPLHNLKPGTRYPATLVTTADHDDRVIPAHSFKFAARLQACQASPAPVLIRIDQGAGHGVGKPISKVIEELADILAFAMQNILHPLDV